MQHITDWLEKLGMSEHAQRFAENRIDFSILPELTDQDLKDLGVVLGDRRKILRAIAALASAPAPVIPPIPPACPRRRARKSEVLDVFWTWTYPSANNIRAWPSVLGPARFEMVGNAPRGCSGLRTNSKSADRGRYSYQGPKESLASALRFYIAQYFRNCNRPYYFLDVTHGTRRPRSQKRAISDTGRTTRPRAA
jgi:hypothetical protein